MSSGEKRGEDENPSLPARTRETAQPALVCHSRKRIDLKGEKKGGTRSDHLRDGEIKKGKGARRIIDRAGELR